MIFLIPQRVNGQNLIYQISHGSGTVTGVNNKMDFIIGQYVYPIDNVASMIVGLTDILVLVQDLNTNIRNIPEKVTGFKVYPNPTKNHLVVEIDALKNASEEYFFKICNVNGGVIYQENYSVSSGKYSKMMNIANLTSGVYYLVIENQKNQIIKTYKIIKQ